jgi:hypothetical protein
MSGLPREPACQVSTVATQFQMQRVRARVCTCRISIARDDDIMTKKRGHAPTCPSQEKANRRQYLIKHGKASAYLPYKNGAEAAADAAGLE